MKIVYFSLLASTLQARQLTGGKFPEFGGDAIRIIRENQSQEDRNLFRDVVIPLLGNGRIDEHREDKELSSTVLSECLQSVVSDVMMIKAKASNNQQLKIAACIYRGFERNSGEGGVCAKECGIVSTVPELAGMTQHQDIKCPNPNGNEKNKRSELEVARCLGMVGADPLLAKQSCTYQNNCGRANTGGVDL